MRFRCPRAPSRSWRLRLSLCLSLTAAALPAQTDPVTVERRLSAMGTALTLAVTGPDRPQALESSEVAVREIVRVEELLSTWKPAGPLDRVNRALPGRPVQLDAETALLLAEVFRWSDRTQGAFDSTVLPLVRAWDLRGRGRVPGAAELSRALEATGRGRFALGPATGRVTRLDPEAGIDEGAWGKGYALDRAATALCATGVAQALLDLGGQLFVLGRGPDGRGQRVAVADPRDRDRAAAWVMLSDASVSTSGNSERGLTVAGRRIGHLLDPRTGRPAADFGSATAICPTGLSADVLSTAFFVLGPEKGLALSETLRQRGFANEALFLVVDGDRLRAVASPGLHFEEE